MERTCVSPGYQHFAGNNKAKPTCWVLGWQVLMAVLRKELEPGLHISRRTLDDFRRFLRVTRFFTSFVRLREVCPAATLGLHVYTNATVHSHLASAKDKV